MKSTITFSVKKDTPLTLPKKISVKIPTTGKTTIEGIINYIPFKSILQTNTQGSHIVINRELGELGAVEITRIGAETETRVPKDLRSALIASPRALAVWMDITPIARRDWIFWIITAKQIETRKRRIEKARSMLSKGKRRVCCFGGIVWLMKNA